MTELKPISEIEKELYESIIPKTSQRVHRELEEDMTLRAVKRFRKAQISMIKLNDVLIALYPWMDGHEDGDKIIMISDSTSLAFYLQKQEGYETTEVELFEISLTKSFDNFEEDTKRKLHTLICSK